MGRYELLFRIAAGGMAEVYAARVLGEAGFQKLVAVKRMLPSLADDTEFVNMFLDEARVAANISSPNVVQTLDLGRDGEGALYIVMELVVGVPLSRIMREASKVRRAVPVGMAIEFIAQAAIGLDAAHEATTPVGEPLLIVHRDVSPQNILIGVDGRLRITDFGVARAVRRLSKTEVGRVKGKFAYCAPEQLRSSTVDRRADIFALGVVAWEVLAAQRLFVADHPLATMERVTSMPILPIVGLRPKVPQAISDIIDAMLDRDPDGRPATGAEVARSLRQAAYEANLELPGTQAISRFVKSAGGDALTKMRANIETALSVDGGSLLSNSEDFRLVDEASGIANAEGSDTHDTGVARAEHSEPDASGVSRTPGSLLPSGPTERKTLKAALAGAFAVVLIAVVGLGVFFALRQKPGPISEPLPAAAPAVVPEQEIAVTPLEVEAEAIEVEVEQAEEVVETAEVPVVTPMRMGMRPRRPTPMTQTVQPVATPVATPVAVVVTMEPTPVMTPTPMRTGSLVGLEAFDRGVD